MPEGKARIDAAVTDTTPSAQAYEALGHLHLKEKREADAMVAFRRAATLDPDDFSAQYSARSCCGTERRPRCWGFRIRMKRRVRRWRVRFN